MISQILQVLAANFAVLWPQYWAQYDFEGTAPTVTWFYGPDALTQQTAPPQITAVLKDELFVGSEVHDASTQRGPNAKPRELSRFWTQVDFYLWGMPGVLPQWEANTAYTVLEDVAPTTANQNGSWFQCTTPGTSDPATEPTWPSTIGATVTDGSVVWTCMGPVANFRVFDTDVTDLMRICLGATLHYTLLGTYRPRRTTWYDATDKLVMDGMTNRLSAEVLIPVPDLIPSSAVAHSLVINV